MKSQPFGKFTSALFNRVGVFAALTLMLGLGTAQAVVVPTVTPATTNLTRGTMSSIFQVTNSVGDFWASFPFYQFSATNGGTLYDAQGAVKTADGSTWVSNGEISTNSYLFKLTYGTNGGAGSGSFTVRAFTNSDANSYTGDPATVYIYIKPSTPTNIPATTNVPRNEVSGIIQLTNNVNDASSDVSNYVFMAITGTLYQSDGSTAITNGQVVSSATIGSGVKFKLTLEQTNYGSFKYSAQGAGGFGGTNSMNVYPGAHAAASISDAYARRGGVNTNGLVIQLNTNDTPADINAYYLVNTIGGKLYTDAATNTQITVGGWFTQTNGLFFVPSPSAGSNGNGYVVIKAWTNTMSVGQPQSDAATGTIYVIGGLPTATPSVTNALRTTATGLIIISNAASDYATEITHFKVSSLTTGTLYKSDGSTVLTNGQFITRAEALAGLKYLMPPVLAGVSGRATFSVKAATSAADAGVGTSAVTVVVYPKANLSQIVTGTAYTRRNVNSTNNLVITNNAGDAWGDVLSYKITQIAGGTLYYPDGVTVVSNTVFEGTTNYFVDRTNANAGLQFKPAASGANPCSFRVQAATNEWNRLGVEQGGLLTNDYATGYIYVLAGTPTATPSVTNAARDVLTDTIVITNASGDNWSEIQYFKVSSITGGKVYQTNGTEVTNTAFVTNVQANAGLQFALTLGGVSGGSFVVQAATNAGDTGVSTGSVTISIGVRANAPGVTPESSTVFTNSWATNIAITVNAKDNALEATHFKVTSLANGVLSNSYTNVSATVTQGQVVAFSDVPNGLNFLPTNGLQTGSFVLQGATNSAGLTVAQGLSAQSVTGTVGVYTYAPIIIPSVVYTHKNVDSALIIITNNVAMDTNWADVQFFKITEITNGTVWTGAQQIAEGTYITNVWANAGILFRPATNQISDGSFKVQCARDANGAGLSATKSNCTIKIAANVPLVTPVTTNAVRGGTNNIQITRTGGDGLDVKYFRFTAITNGNLSYGGTAIASGNYLTNDAATVTVQFARSAAETASFVVQVSRDGTNTSALSYSATNSITMLVNLPSVAATTATAKATQTAAITISRGGSDGAEVTHFQIASIFGGTVYQADGTTLIGEGSYITADEGAAGVKFTPAGAAGYGLQGNFTVKGATNSGAVPITDSNRYSTAWINTIAQVPTAASVSTYKNIMATGLTITPNAIDVGGVTHFKITSIANGTLYKNDGTTVISEGSYITVVEGAAGLKFMPTTDSLLAGTYNAAGSADASGTGLGTAATATITVLAGAPVVSTLVPANGATGGATNATLSVTFDQNIYKGTGNIVIYYKGGTVVETIPVASVVVSASTATITPSAALLGQTNYYVQIAAGAFTNSVGAPFAGITDTTTWTFTAIDTSAAVLTMAGLPPSSTTSTTANITVGGTTVGGSTIASYRYKLDAGSYGTTNAVANNIVLSGLSAGSHTVSAIGVNLIGVWQSVATSYTWTVVNTLTAPTGVEASDSAYTDKVLVQWTAVSDAVGYQVWRNTSGGSDSATLIGVTTATLYNDTTATAGTQYYFWIKATNTAGASAFSSPNAGTRRAADPTPATNANISVYIAAYDQADGGIWKIWLSDGNILTITTFGATNWVPVMGDFDGDQRTDLAVYKESLAEWAVLLSMTEYNVAVVWAGVGGPGYVPACGDYDGDGADEIGAYKAASGKWQILLTGGGVDIVTSSDGFLGDAASVGIPADFDGDGKADFAVYAAATGTWQVRFSLSDYALGVLAGFGTAGSMAQPVDYDGDQKADVGYYEPSTGNWVLKLSGLSYVTLSTPFGGPMFEAIADDYDRDGLADLAVYNEGTGEWLIRLTSKEYGQASLTLGGANYTPLGAFVP